MVQVADDGGRERDSSSGVPSAFPREATAAEQEKQEPARQAFVQGAETAARIVCSRFRQPGDKALQRTLPHRVERADAEQVAYCLLKAEFAFANVAL